MSSASLNNKVLSSKNLELQTQKLGLEDMQTPV